VLTDCVALSEESTPYATVTNEVCVAEGEESMIVPVGDSDDELKGELESSVDEIGSELEGTGP